MESQFINKNNLTFLNNDLTHKLGLQSKSAGEKRNCLQVLLGNMKNVYQSLDKSKITDQNIDKIMKAFNKYSIDKTVQDIQSKPSVNIQNKPKINVSQYERDKEISGKKNVTYMDRPDFNAYNTDNRYSNFDLSERNHSYNTSINRDTSGLNLDDSLRSGQNSRRDTEVNVPPEKQYEQLLQSRNIEVPSRNQRPSTPDFSLDGSGAKEKKNNLNYIENFNNVKQDDQMPKQMNNSFLSNEPEKIQLEGNRMDGDTYYLTGSNLDSNFGNVQFSNNELSNNLPEIDESISVSDRLKQLQSERSSFDTTISDNQQSGQQNNQQSSQQNNQQNNPTYQQQRDLQLNNDFQKQQIEAKQREMYEYQQRQAEIKKYEDYNTNYQNNMPKKETIKESFTNKVDMQQNIPNQQLYDMINTMYQTIPKDTSKDVQKDPYLLKQEKRMQEESSKNEDKMSKKVISKSNEMNNFLNDIAKNQIDQLKQIQYLQDQMQNQLQNQNFSNTSVNSHDDDRVKNELISKVKILTGELEQYKKVNNDLKKRLDDEIGKKTSDNDKKIKLIEQKKGEIKEEVLRLGNKHKEIESSYSKLLGREKTIKKLIDDNSKYLNISRRSFVIDSSDFNKSSKYSYNLGSNFKNINRIELVSYDFPEITNNINETNNKLYFKIEVIKSIETGNESDNSEVKGSEEYEEVIQVNIPNGSYDISTLIKKMNKLCKAYHITFTYNKNSNLVTVKSDDDEKFTLFNEKSDSILKILGFQNNQYDDEYNFISENSYDIRKNKYIKVTFTNFEDPQFCELSTENSTNKIYFKDYNNLNKSTLDIELRDSSNNLIDFCNLHHKLEFVITSKIENLTLKSFNINNDNIDDNLDDESDNMELNINSEEIEDEEDEENDREIEEINNYNLENEDNPDVLIKKLQMQLNQVELNN